MTGGTGSWKICIWKNNRHILYESQKKNWTKATFYEKMSIYEVHVNHLSMTT